MDLQQKLRSVGNVSEMFPTKGELRDGKSLGEKPLHLSARRVPPDVGPRTTTLADLQANMSEKRVIVIGAGASGIGAARTLIESGIQPIILEARDRIGGRMHSTFLKRNLLPRGAEQSTDDDLQITVQLGANWIHGLDDSNPFYVVAKKLNLHLHMTSSDDEPGNDVILFDEGADDLSSDKDPANSSAFCRVTAQEYKEALERYEWIRDNFERLTLPQKELHLKECLERVLTASEEFFGPCSECHRRCFNWFFDRVSIDLAAPLEYAATDSYLEVETDGFSGEALVSGGYFQVLKHLATEYPLDVRYNHVVSKVTYVSKGERKPLSASSPHLSDGACVSQNESENIAPAAATAESVCGVDGECLGSDADGEYGDREEHQLVVIECTNGAVFEVDACLVTLPIGVLQTSAVEFTPHVPKQIAHLCGLVKAGLMNIVWLWYPSCFWPEDCNFLGVAHKDTALVEFGTFLAPPMFDQNGTRQAVLMCQVVGKFAEEVEGMTEHDVAARATAVLRAMFGHALVPDAIGCIHSAWKSDPFSRGSWTHIPYKDRSASMAMSGATDSATCDSMSNYSVGGSDLHCGSCDDGSDTSSSSSSDDEHDDEGEESASESDSDSDSSSSDDEDDADGHHGDGMEGRKAGRKSRKMVRFSFEQQQHQQDLLLTDVVDSSADFAAVTTSFEVECKVTASLQQQEQELHQEMGSHCSLLLPFPGDKDPHSAPPTMVTGTIDDCVYYSGEASNTEHRGTAHSAYMSGIEEAQKMVFYLSLVTR